MPPAPKTKFEPLTVKKVVADVTKRFYTTSLNKIASGGFSTIKQLLDNQEKVLEIVKDQPADRQKGMMNAIFYALSDHPNEHKKTYYNYFQILKKKDPKYVEYMKKESEKPAPAPAAAQAPAPAKAKRKYTKTEKFFNQARFKKAEETKTVKFDTKLAASEKKKKAKITKELDTDLKRSKKELKASMKELILSLTKKKE